MPPLYSTRPNLRNLFIKVSANTDQFPGFNAQGLGTVTLAELGSPNPNRSVGKGLIFLGFLAGRSKIVTWFATRSRSIGWQFGWQLLDRRR